MFVDGKLVGEVPLERPLRLPAGKHTLKVIKQGFSQYLDVVRIVRGKPTVVEVDLLPIAGVLLVKASETGAKVFIDGNYRGLAPLEAELKIGKHSIRVQKAGFHDFITTRAAIAGERREVLATLKEMAVSPYRPAPLPPPRWYEKWYVWLGIAGGVVAVAVAVAVPVAIGSKDPLSSAEIRFNAN